MLVYLCYGRLVYFTAIRFFGPFGVFYGDLIYFSRFGVLYQEKSGNPVIGSRRKTRRSFQDEGEKSFEHASKMDDVTIFVR
jgi:hypothetical protein